MPFPTSVKIFSLSCPYPLHARVKPVCMLFEHFNGIVSGLGPNKYPFQISLVKGQFLSLKPAGLAIHFDEFKIMIVIGKL
jgi:hypothetical protein